MRKDKKVSDAKYYRRYYYNGDRVEYINDNFEVEGWANVTIDTFGEITLEATGLPAVDDDMIEVVGRYDILGQYALETEPIEGTDKYLKVLSHKNYTKEQLEKYSRNCIKK